MSQGNKISLATAMLICMNVMFGTGIFINTVTLAKMAGGLAFLSYASIALLILPLILSMASITSYFPSGGFYAYGARCISPLAGFIGCWAYFVGKLGSATLLVHVFVSLLKNIFPFLTIDTIFLTAAIIILFAWLNLYKAETGKKIMYVFMVFKLLPIVFAILSCLYLFNSWSMPPDTLLWANIPATVPIVLFAFVGFEVATSISRNVENSKVNTPKVILYSFFAVISITIVYQLFFFLALGKELMAQTNYLGAFPALLTKLLPGNPVLAIHAKNIIHLIAATSALGGAYAILFSNHWNLYTLAQNKHTFFPKSLTRLNKYDMPYWCIIIEAIICLSYLFLTQGKMLILQQVSVFGGIIAYTISMIALLKVYKGEQQADPKTAHSLALPLFGLISCVFIIGVCIRNLLIDGPTSLYAFLGIICLGVAMFLLSTKTTQAAHPIEP